MISPLLYGVVYLYLIIFLTFGEALKVREYSFTRIQNSHNKLLYPILICSILAIWLGNRPSEFYHVFGDSYTYAHNFHLYELDMFDSTEKKGEVIWNYAMMYSAQRISVELFFTIVSCVYFGLTLWASIKFTRNNPLATFLFFLGSLSFYSYATNGLRNGVACSLVLVGLAFLTNRNIKRVIAIIFFITAFFIHRSTILPIGMAFVAILFRQQFKLSLIFWILSIVISITIGNTISNFLAGLGFDDRVESYLITNAVGDKNAGGFRWDFLVYSAMPILLGYYIVIKRQITDNKYLFLLNTYTLTNAFWVMIIRASFSNRIAYLSWFMLPIVLAYPLLKLNIWDDQQGKRLAQIMLAQVGFTWFMDTFVWTTA
ncbi:MAG: EpsG family protein [Muribaculaceae bacterium]|nr:EpsG family protein [Muribaculaceae bacterium]